jgi:nucleoside-diphosphate-sugar epimerase
VKVAVTGASGFIGSALCSRLAACGHRVVAVSRGELLDEDRLRNAVTGADAVVHLAALAHDAAQALEKAGDYETLRRVNALTSETLARACAGSNVPRFVFMSSIGVCGEETRGRPFDETSAPAPRSLYAASKHEAEQRLGEVAAKTGLRLTVLRPTLVYGPGNRGNFLRLMRLVARGVPLPLGAVRNRRNFTYVGNLVSATEALLAPEAPGGLFIACDSEAFSTPQVVACLGAGMGRAVRQISVPPAMLSLACRAVGRGDLARRLLGSLEADNAKLRNLARWSAAPAEPALRATARWFSEEVGSRSSG